MRKKKTMKRTIENQKWLFFGHSIDDTNDMPTELQQLKTYSPKWLSTQRAKHSIVQMKKRKKVSSLQLPCITPYHN